MHEYMYVIICVLYWAKMQLLYWNTSVYPELLQPAKLLARFFGLTLSHLLSPFSHLFLLSPVSQLLSPISLLPSPFSCLTSSVSLLLSPFSCLPSLVSLLLFPFYCLPSLFSRFLSSVFFLLCCTVSAADLIQCSWAGGAVIIWDLEPEAKFYF